MGFLGKQTCMQDFYWGMPAEITIRDCVDLDGESWITKWLKNAVMNPQTEEELRCLSEFSWIRYVSIQNVRIFPIYWMCIQTSKWPLVLLGKEFGVTIIYTCGGVVGFFLFVDCPLLQSAGSGSGQQMVQGLYL